MNTNGLDNIDFNMLTGGMIAVLAIILILTLALGIFIIIGYWKLYKKAGYNGYEAIIPFYSQWVLTKIAGLKEYWFILSIASIIVSAVDIYALSVLASFVSLLFRIGVAYNLKEKFHKNNTWFIFAVLFSGIVIPLLGYSNSEVYDKDAVVSADAFLKKADK